MGPGAGHDGGRVVFEGTPADLARAKGSLTGQFLARHGDSAAPTGVE
jgi:excinuclease UvrABC ATPase subunit